METKDTYREHCREIIKHHRDIMGTADCENVTFVRQGTNMVFDNDGRFIIKICPTPIAEQRFEVENHFYELHKDSGSIPKLYMIDKSKTIVPCSYKIIEKLPGDELSVVWHNLTKSEKEDCIRQICFILKEFHRVETPKYDWSNHIKSQVEKSYEEKKSRGIFTENEEHIIETSLAYYDRILNSEHIRFATLHNDIHMENLIYHHGVIKAIDFERSVDAPIDFEMDTISKEVNYVLSDNPIAVERGITNDDLSEIFNQIKLYYPEMMNVPYLDLRIAVYDIRDFIRFCDRWVKFKERVVNRSAQIVDFFNK